MRNSSHLSRFFEAVFHPVLPQVEVLSPAHARPITSARTIILEFCLQLLRVDCKPPSNREVAKCGFAECTAGPGLRRMDNGCGRQPTATGERSAWQPSR